MDQPALMADLGSFVKCQTFSDFFLVPAQIYFHLSFIFDQTLKHSRIQKNPVLLTTNRVARMATKQEKEP